MKQENRFSRWWRNIQKMEPSERKHKIQNWLNYATRTAAYGLGQDEQRVIYTIRDRYAKSTYKRLSTRNARKVFFLVNQHGRNYAKLREQNTELRRLLKNARESGPQVVRRTTRTVTSRGGTR